MPRQETGAEELRKIVRVLNNTREGALDGFTAEELIRIVRACLASPFDITPDYLHYNEARHAIRYQKLSPRCLARLEKAL